MALLERAARRLRLFRRRKPVQQHGASLLREPDRDGEAEAAGRSGDEGAAAGEICHASITPGAVSRRRTPLTGRPAVGVNGPVTAAANLR
jgi:hypothetical protein